ncbi:hypothetical protein GCM10008955_40150 [Deinococcus malanensis]|uniref:PDZ domain-containing protein n=2 Tax=Deinococcus malanensis TaxID=1706855 RepID=A0ABQ2F2D5_9DEIO|nr:hypothetical protein GCM10008955_40150 [Deinococcus malanensis]
MVQTVTSNTPAEKAGLRWGDEIVEVNGQSVLHLSDAAMRLLLRGKVCTKLTVGVKRNGLARVQRITASRVLIRTP